MLAMGSAEEDNRYRGKILQRWNFRGGSVFILGTEIGCSGKGYSKPTPVTVRVE
jgi:hypothetical protein